MGSLKTLEAVLKHRPIDLPQDIHSDLDHIVGSNSQDVPVKGRVMKLAESYAVGGNRIALWMSVRKDMRGFQ